MARPTPPNTLENLKREAKRWLKALRANVGEARARLERALPNAPDVVTLRDVQHALAREMGYAGWAALKDTLAARPALARCEEMAADFLEAYRTGTPEAMERLWRHAGHRRNWETTRRYAQLDLGKRPAADGEDVPLTMDDARRLVAKGHGFESWAALAEFETRLTTGPRRTTTARPVALLAPDDAGRIQEIERTRDWDAALDGMAQRRVAALDAEGQMTDEMLHQLSSLEHVTTLRLGGSKALTDAGVRHLARMRGLRELDLGGCPITDAALEVLGELPALESVGLWGTRVTDAGVRHLAACPALRRVDLAGTRTGDGAIAALAGKPALAHFRSGEGVTDAGLARLHDFPVFTAWRGGDVTLALTSADAEPNSLFLRGSITDRGLATLAGLDGLFALNVDDAKLAITGAGLAPLVEGLPRLGFLAFDAKDDAMPYIAAMPRLRLLMAQDTVAGDDGFVALSRSRSIEYIWGRRCHNLRSRGFAALADMPALRALSVSCKNVDDAGLAALPRFPTLRELMPMDVPDAGYRFVGQCAQLESLILMYCRDTTDAATEHITGLDRLTHYFASYTQITDRTPELLAGMPSLERIELSGCPGVTNAGIAALARSPRLRELSLGGVQNVTREVLNGFPAAVRVSYSP